MNTFSKVEAIKYGWQKMKENFWFFVGIMVVTFIIGFIPVAYRVFAKVFSIDSIAISFIVNIVYLILSIIITLGIIKIVLSIAREEKVEYGDLFSQTNLFLILKYFLAKILFLVVVGIGLILFIVPGIILAVKFMFWPYFMVDKKMGPIESLKASSKITAGNKWNLFLFGILSALINILGVLVFFVGIFITAPIMMMAYVFVYRKLSGEIDANIPENDANGLIYNASEL